MSPFSLLRAPPSEQLPVAMIVEDDNKMLSKVLLALTELCSEMDSLCDDDALGEFADLLLFYGEADSAAAALNSAPLHERHTGVLGAVSTDIAEDLLVPRALPERREQRHCA